jgi:hypothetical protein
MRVSTAEIYFLVKTLHMPVGTARTHGSCWVVGRYGMCKPSCLKRLIPFLINDGVFPQFKRTPGVVLGSSLLPALFNSFIDSLLRLKCRVFLPSLAYGIDNGLTCWGELRGSRMLPPQQSFVKQYLPYVVFTKDYCSFPNL